MSCPVPDAERAESDLIAAVLPDVSGIDRIFDYSVPADLADEVVVGTIVRVPLRGRRVRGWVVRVAEEPTPRLAARAGEQQTAGAGEQQTARGGAQQAELERPGGAPERSRPLRPVVAVLSVGPPEEVVELARWASWRWAGRLRPFLLAASPPRLVHRPLLAAPRPGLPASPQPPGSVQATARAGDVAAAARSGGAVEEAAALAVAGQPVVLRLSPAAARFPVVQEVIARFGSEGVLLLVPERRDAEVLRGRLARAGVAVALLPEQWDLAAAGGCVAVGARAAAFAPLPTLRAAVVLDAHDEAYREQRSPTWSAPALLAERSRRNGAALLFVSACPPLDLLALGRLVVPPRPEERSGWPALEVIDRRGEDPRSGRYSPLLASRIHAARRSHPELAVVCVLNRLGRTRLLACASCGELARCEACGAAVHEPRRVAGNAGQLVCPACGAARPLVCAACGSARLSRLRVGSGGAAEELAALTGLEVAEVSGAPADRPVSRRPGSPGEVTPDDRPDGPVLAADEDRQRPAEVLVGTEAVLHRVRRASLVVFLDLDAELLAPRLRAGEQALALLARAGRMLGGRHAGEGAADGGAAPDRAGTGRLLLQTRLPEHEVVRAARFGDPGLVADAERERREPLGLPPYSSLALISGPEASDVGAALRAAGAQLGDAGSGRLLVRAPSAAALADVLAASGALGADVRVEVDPTGV